jgi:hypothetical protein
VYRLLNKEILNAHGTEIKLNNKKKLIIRVTNAILMLLTAALSGNEL